MAVNGAGTMLYGSADRRSDESYIATKWITFLWLLLLPLGSCRVWITGREYRHWGNQSTTYYKEKKVPLQLRHVVMGYLISLPILIGVILSDTVAEESIARWFS